MPFSRIRFLGFRNAVDAEIPVPAEQVFFIGPNGQGKSNFLEALYLLCYGSSFRTRKDEHLVRHGADQAAVWGYFDDGFLEKKIQVRFAEGKKEIRVDDKILSDRRDLMDTVPCVVFCHEDIDFVKGEPEFQRQFFNQTASLMIPSFIPSLRNYVKALKTRNLVLKERRLDLLAAYDVQLAAYGLEITARRHQVSAVFNEHFAPLLSAMNPDLAALNIRYRPSWKMDHQDAVIQWLSERGEHDIRMGTTCSGPHRDRYHFDLGGNDFLSLASTGQMRLVSLVMRLCQAIIVGAETGKRPILLLDDVLLELDPLRRREFVSRLPDAEQMFFTFLPDADLASYVRGSHLVYIVDGGAYRAESL